jgi:ATP-dependent Lon protease
VSDTRTPSGEAARGERTVAPCYIDLEDGVERFVTVPEQSGGALVPEGRLQPGTLHTISMGALEMPGIYRLEIQSIPGGGKINVSGAAPREAMRVAFDYFKANFGFKQI